MTTEKNDSRICNTSSTLIFACSGAADVGAIADQTARKLTRAGSGKMFCLAGVGGRLAGIIKNTAAASKLLAIDGCPLNCAKACLGEAGFTEVEHLQLADLGMIKGSTEISEENINKATDACMRLLGGRTDK